jgi:hypothetical protein
MSPPVRVRDDDSVPSAQRELLGKAPGSRPIPKDVRARSTARVHRLLVVPAAAGLLLWMKTVAAAGLCVLGVVAAVHAVPALARWAAPVTDPLPAPSMSAPHREPPPREVAPAVPVPALAPESAVGPPAASSVGEPSPVLAQPPTVRRRPASATPEASRADPSAADPLAREAAMLEEARALLNRDPSTALAIADRHAAVFPAGSLGIERELLAVQALQRLGRFAEARTRGTGLLEQARGTIYEHRVKAMLETTAPP